MTNTKRDERIWHDPPGIDLEPIKPPQNGDLDTVSKPYLQKIKNIQLRWEFLLMGSMYLIIGGFIYIATILGIDIPIILTIMFVSGSMFITYGLTIYTKNGERRF